MNDFQIPLRPPNRPLYLNTEFIGHMYPTKRNDNVERITEHTMRHARVHNQLASDKRYAGGLGWCAFDYNTHSNFCSGDRVCYHGVSDIFRIPKPAAGFYKSQCDRKRRSSSNPLSTGRAGDRNETFTIAMICSNCEHVKIYMADRLIAELDPDRKEFPHLKYPPFVANIRPAFNRGWGDLRMDGYIGGKKVISKSLSGKGADQQFHLEPDDRELLGDGIDATASLCVLLTSLAALVRLPQAQSRSASPGPARLLAIIVSLFGGCGSCFGGKPGRASGE